VPVFVSVNPEYDTPEKLIKFRDELYGPDLLILRESKTGAPDLQDVLRKFKVPYGLNDVEKDQMQGYFESEAEKAQKASYFSRFNTWLSGNQRKSVAEAADGALNDHSKAIFLMAPDNKFLNFYRLDLTEKELATQIIEDASYDIG